MQHFEKRQNLKVNLRKLLLGAALCTSVAMTVSCTNRTQGPERDTKNGSSVQENEDSTHSSNIDESRKNKAERDDSVQELPSLPVRPFEISINTEVVGKINPNRIGPVVSDYSKRHYAYWIRKGSSFACILDGEELDGVEPFEIEAESKYAHQGPVDRLQIRPIAEKNTGLIGPSVEIANARFQTVRLREKEDFSLYLPVFSSDGERVAIICKGGKVSKDKRVTNFDGKQVARTTDCVIAIVELTDKAISRIQIKGKPKFAADDRLDAWVWEAPIGYDYGVQWKVFSTEKSQTLWSSSQNTIGDRKSATGDFGFSKILDTPPSFLLQEFGGEYSFFGTNARRVDFRSSTRPRIVQITPSSEARPEDTVYARCIREEANSEVLTIVPPVGDKLRFNDVCHFAPSRTGSFVFFSAFDGRIGKIGRITEDTVAFMDQDFESFSDDLISTNSGTSVLFVGKLFESKEQAVFGFEEGKLAAWPILKDKRAGWSKSLASSFFISDDKEYPHEVNSPLYDDPSASGFVGSHTTREQVQFVQLSPNAKFLVSMASIRPSNHSFNEKKRKDVILLAGLFDVPEPSRKALIDVEAVHSGFVLQKGDKYLLAKHSEPDRLARTKKLREILSKLETGYVSVDPYEYVAKLTEYDNSCWESIEIPVPENSDTEVIGTLDNNGVFRWLSDSEFEYLAVSSNQLERKTIKVLSNR